MKMDWKAYALAGLLLCASRAGQAELVVIGNLQAPANALNIDQVSQVFLGVSTSYTPVDQTDASPLRAEFYKKVTGKEPGQVKAIWSKLVFTGKGKLPKEYASSADVKKAVSADPNAIGYIEKSAVDGSIKVLLTVP